MRDMSLLRRVVRTLVTRVTMSPRQNWLWWREVQGHQVHKTQKQADKVH